MPDALLRQIEMLRHIPRSGSITTQLLQERLARSGYDISERSIQRDLVRLSSKLPLTCDETSKPHKWHWMPDAPACQLPGLSTPEALAFQMLEQFETDLLPATIRGQLAPYFTASKQHLSADVGPKAARNWLAKVRVVSPNQPLLPAAVSPEVVEAVHRALMEDKCVEIVYRSKPGKQFVIHPLGLVQHGATIYIVAKYDGYEDPRILALHRVKRAAILEQSSCPPSGFDLNSYIASGAFGFGEIGKSIKLELRFFNDAARHLTETRLSDDQECIDEGPGQTYVKATVQMTRRLHWWLRGFGPDVEVIKPASLRRDVAKSLADAVQRY